MGCSFPSVSIPSMVTTLLPAISPTAVMHDLTGSLSISTVHEPQNPIPQPNLVPVRPKLFLRTQRRIWLGSVTSSVSLPFSLNRIASSIILRFCLFHSCNLHVYLYHELPRGHQCLTPGHHPGVSQPTPSVLLRQAVKVSPLCTSGRQSAGGRAC